MIEKKNVSSLQIAVLVFYLIKGGIFGLGFPQIEAIAHQDAWICQIIGAVAGFIPLFIFLYIANHRPEFNIIELNQKLFGKFLGFIINLLLILIIAFIGMATLANLARFVQNNFLMRTPTLVICLLFLSVIYMVATKGIEVISRMALFLLPLSIFVFLLAVWGLLPFIDLANIKPIFESGTNKILMGALKYISFTTAPLFLLLIVPKQDMVDQKNFNRNVIIWYIIINGGTFITFFWTTTILGHHLASLYTYPIYEIYRKISFFHFIDRVENNIIIHRIFDLFFIITLSMNFIKEAIQSTFKMTNEIWSNVIIIVTGIIFLIFPSYLFVRRVEWQNWTFLHYPIIIGVGIFSITAIILIRLLFDRKKTYS